MPRLADFADAHRRHLEDADLLFDNDRWANADHLYGLSAECGLKAIMLGLGMDVDAKGTPPREQEHKQHMPGLVPVFRDFAHQRGGGAYLASLPARAPFDDWSIGDRYAHRRHFRSANVAPHRAAACRVGQFVQRARQDGVL